MIIGVLMVTPWFFKPPMFRIRYIVRRLFISKIRGFYRFPLPSPSDFFRKMTDRPWVVRTVFFSCPGSFFFSAFDDVFIFL